MTRSRYYIIFELVKNSLRATVDFHQQRLGDAFDCYEVSGAMSILMRFPF
jgi:hypothetical protein